MGERKLSGGNYGPWQWWNNTYWVANVLRPDNFEERKFLSDEAKEFQLHKSRFSDHTFSMMFHIEYPATLATNFPPKADTLASSGWKTFEQ